MTAVELAEEVWKCLDPEVRKRVTLPDVKVVVKLLFETIVQEIMLGNVVQIRNFGTISATFIKGGNLVWCEFAGRDIPRKPNIRLHLKPARRLKKMIGKARMHMRALARKQQEDEGGKVRLRTGEEGREGEGGSGEGQVSEVREPSEW